MASLVKDLVEAGIHFGSRSNHWNPKMAPYIYAKRQKMHIIDVKQTIKGLLLARKFVTQTVAEGKDVLFVGTKRQARAIIEENAASVGMPYMTERWLGGTLTNFGTIRQRLKRLEELEQLEQSGEIDTFSKKMGAQLQREKGKILSNMGGIRNMSKLPGAMVIVDVGNELNAVKEARKLGIPTVCLIDTDSDPGWADIPIPGNDDAMRAIETVIKSLTAAAAEGKQARAVEEAEKAAQTEDQGQGQGTQRRRSRRAQFRADGADGADATAQEDQTSTQPGPGETGTPTEAPPTAVGETATEPEPTKMGPAHAEGDTEKDLTSPAGQNDTNPRDRSVGVGG